MHASAQAATGFPNLESVTVPSGPSATPTALSLIFNGEYNQVFVTDYSHAVPVANTAQPYTVLVPDVSVPLATYTGWNYRGSGHAIGEGCISNGAAIPFALSSGGCEGGGRARQTRLLAAGRCDERLHQQRGAGFTDPAAESLNRHGVSSRSATQLQHTRRRFASSLLCRRRWRLEAYSSGSSTTS